MLGGIRPGELSVLSPFMPMNQTPLDDGVTNSDRASWAEAALIVFAQRTGWRRKRLVIRRTHF
jgi:hypothetical protein